MASQNINAMQSLWANSQLSGGNNAFVESLYEDYLADPSTLSESWRAYFDSLQSTTGASHEVAHSPIRRGFTDLPTGSRQACSGTAAANSSPAPSGSHAKI